MTTLLAITDAQLQIVVTAIVGGVVTIVLAKINKTQGDIAKEMHTIKEQGNSQHEQFLRVRLANALRSVEDTPESQANRVELASAKQALEGHLRMQDKVDMMPGRAKSAARLAVDTAKVAEVAGHTKDVADEVAQTAANAAQTPSIETKATP